MTLLLLFFFCCQDGSIANSPTSLARIDSPVVDYDIAVTLVPDRQLLQGNLQLEYTNHSPDIIGELQFHAYLNGSKNNASTYYRDGGTSESSAEPSFGYMEIKQCWLRGKDRTNQLSFIQARDSNPQDRTVFALPLESPLMPGETIQVAFQFEAKLPQRWNRSGYEKDYFTAAQWFPKLGVWETRGFRGAAESAWNCHATRGNAEYFANFGNYKVSITTPADYVVGATGVLQGEVSRNGGNATHTYVQKRVHDFAWTAWPQFIKVSRSFEPDQEIIEMLRLQLGLTEQEMLLDPVQMTLLIPPNYKGQADRYFTALNRALTWFGLCYSPYPYQSISMVCPPARAGFSGGMEYPTLLMLGTYFHNPEGFLELEDLIFHEFAHQYFYGLVATNETEESWMDEGFTSYVTDKLLGKLYPSSHDYFNASGNQFLPFWSEALGLPNYYASLRMLQLSLPRCTFFGLKSTTPLDRTRHASFDDQGIDPIARETWRFHSNSFLSNAYTKPAMMLNQLEREIGEIAMHSVMRTYVDRWSYKHPTEADFIHVVEEVTGMDMAWFFQPMLHGTGTLDFFPEKPSSQPIRFEGYQDRENGPEYVLGHESDLIRSTVILRKKGSINYPVDVLVSFDDGSQVRERWAGDHPWTSYSYEKDAKLISVLMDPDQKVLCDQNLANNAWLAAPDKRASKLFSMQLLLIVQNILHFLGGEI